MSREVMLGIPEHAMPAFADLQMAIHRAGGTPCEKQPDLWTGTEREQQAAARACLECPVFAACGRYALQADETSAVYAGQTSKERRARFRARTTTRGAAA